MNRDSLLANKYLLINIETLLIKKSVGDPRFSPVKYTFVPMHDNRREIMKNITKKIKYDLR